MLCKHLNLFFACCTGGSTFLLKDVSLLFWTISEGSGGSPAGAEDEGWHLHPHGGHRDIARVEHAVQVSVISLGICRFGIANRPWVLKSPPPFDYFSISRILYYLMFCKIKFLISDSCFSLPSSSFFLSSR